MTGLGWTQAGTGHPGRGAFRRLKDGLDEEHPDLSSAVIVEEGASGTETFGVVEGEVEGGQPSSSWHQPNSLAGPPTIWCPCTVIHNSSPA